MIVSRDAKNINSYVRTTLTFGVLEFSPLLTLMHATGFIFLIFFGFFVENHLLSEHKIQFLLLTV